MDELTAWLTLARAPGLHAGVLHPLLQQFSSAAEIFAARSNALRASGAGASLIEWLNAHRTHDATAEKRWLEGESHYFIRWGDDRYPPMLAQIGDAPVALFVSGDANALLLPQLAIVGSRNPSPAGRENAARFAAHLVRCGLTITSGLAIGVDAASHCAALDAGGATVAVCGAGVDVVYPRSNEALAREIVRNGALVSEFPLGSAPLKNNFPRRNRIISGLSLGVLVVEAALRSGSLITARLAAEQGREVFAIPGSIHNALSRGCHRLIREGAKLVESTEDIFVELHALCGALRLAPPREVEERAARKNPPAALDKGYEILLDALGFEPAGVDALVARTGFGADAVASMLLVLELEGCVESYPGGLYVQRASHRAERSEAAK